MSLLDGDESLLDGFAGFKDGGTAEELKSELGIEDIGSRGELVLT